MTPRPRIGFAGTPEFAAVILKALLDHGHQVAVVYTQPDRRAGRGRKPRSSAVKTLAEAWEVTVRQPSTLRGEKPAAELAGFHLDVLVVAAYGLILPRRILALPKYGCVNVHASLLPRWRGAAPVEHAIMAGDTQTGVSIMQMDAGLDTGPVLARASYPIDDTTCGPDLELALAHLGARSLLTCLAELDTLTPQPQTHTGVSYAPKLRARDSVIDWLRPARDIHRQVRALCGRAPATTSLGDLRIRILAAEWEPDVSPERPGTIEAVTGHGIRVACGCGSLIVGRLQLNRGQGRPLCAADAVNGYPAVFKPGTSFDPRPA